MGGESESYVPDEYKNDENNGDNQTESNQQTDNSLENRLSKDLQNKLEHSLKDLLSNNSKAHESVASREFIINEKDALNALEEYGIDTSQIEKVKGGVYRIPVQSHFSASRLPEGYAYKGGAARALLNRNLGIDPKATPRDTDIVRMVNDEPNPGADQQVAKHFMPEDFSHGDGVEPIESLDDYFSTRDLTINEILATDKEIFISEDSLLDNIRHIIRLTEFEHAEYGGPGPKMISKMIRLYAESIIKWEDSTIEGLDEMKLEEYFVPPFWLALQMDRAYQQSKEIAESYTKQLLDLKQIPDHIDSADEAAVYLASLITDSDFYYRYAPKSQFDIEEKWVDEYEEYDKLPKFEGFGRVSPTKHKI